MSGNKQAYTEAYERAKEGRSRPFWQILMAPFTDEYTRQSRAKGERDGAAARAQLMAQAEPQEQTSAPTA